MAEAPRLRGLLAEFATPGDLLEAASRVRDAGYRRWDTMTPFPVHGLERAMGLRDSRLPWFTLLAGLAGLTTAILMQWWMNAVDYPLLISGKPMFSLPANIPIAFELTVLFASVATAVGLFLLCDLPRLWHPTLTVPRFRRVTTDGFFVWIESDDPAFDAERTAELLRSLGPVHVQRVEV